MKSRQAWFLAASAVVVMGASAVQAQSTRIMFSSDRAPLTADYDVWTMKETGENQTQVTNESPGDAHNPSISRNGQHIVYDVGGELYLKPVSGSGGAQILTAGSANPCADGDDCYDPAAGPIVNGAGDFLIVFTSDYPYVQSQVYVATVDVSAGTLVNPVAMTNDPLRTSYEASWCGDDHIVFARSGEALPYTYEICTMPLASPGVATCYFTMADESPNFVNDGDPSCNAAGTKIAWAREQGPEYGYTTRDIWTMMCDANMVCDAANATNLINDGPYPYDDTHPSWSPSGTVLTFASTRPFVGQVNPEVQDYEIFVMNSDGSGMDHRTDNTAEDVEPDYGPGLLQ